MVKLLLVILLFVSCNQKPSFKPPLVDLKAESAWAKDQFIEGPNVKSIAVLMQDEKGCDYLIAYTKDSIEVKDSNEAIRGLVRELVYKYDHPVVVIIDNTGDTVRYSHGDTIYLHNSSGGTNDFKYVTNKYQINEKSLLAARYGTRYKLRIRATTAAREIEKRYSTWRLSIRQRQRYN